MDGVAIKMEQRKIQLTGGSTYIISLPISWIRECKLDAGDALGILPNNNRTLTIFANLQEEIEKSESTIEFSENDVLEDKFRILISHYLAGYDVIKLTSKNGFHAHERKFFKDAIRHRLIGIEVIEESRKEMVFQSLMNYEELPLDKALQNMTRLIDSMLYDALLALKTLNKELAQDVINRDNEIDRFHLLTVRQLKAAVEDSTLASKIGIEKTKHCLAYRLITKIMERIGDHVEKIAKQILVMEEHLKEKDILFEMSNLAQKVFTDSMKCLSDFDVENANKIINYARKFEEYTAVYNKKQTIEQSINVGKIIASLKRITEYSADIAEMSINMRFEREKN